MAIASIVRTIAQAADIAIHGDSQPGQDHLIIRCDEILGRGELCERSRVELLYIKANVLAARRERLHKGQSTVWNWRDPDLEAEILARRVARQSPAIQDVPQLVRAWHAVNLGNLYSHIGRPVAAIAEYRLAMRLRPGLGMARCNLALAAMSLARHLHDPSHQAYIAWWAIRDFRKSLRCRIEPHARSAVRAEIQTITRSFGEQWLRSELPEYHEDQPEDDRAGFYRKWCLSNGLYVNPLADYPATSIASQDLVLTSMRASSPDPAGPEWVFSALNALLQEYASARYGIWNATQIDQCHLSDLDVKLARVRNDVIYSYQIESVKSAYRLLWSLLDKVAIVVNENWSLGLSPRRVSFRSVWHEQGDQRRGLAKVFSAKPNLPLRGLYWLSRDLYESDATFVSALDPEMCDLADLRNKLEHRVVHVVSKLDEPWSPKSEVLSQSFIELSDLARRALCVAKFAREALLYLGIAIYTEERLQRDGVSMSSSTIELDKWSPEDRGGRNLGI